MGFAYRGIGGTGGGQHERFLREWLERQVEHVTRAEFALNGTVESQSADRTADRNCGAFTLARSL